MGNRTSARRFGPTQVGVEAFALLSGLLIACVQPPPSDGDNPPARSAAKQDTEPSGSDSISMKPDCAIDAKEVSSAEEGAFETVLTEQERRLVFRAVLEIREDALREAQKAFPIPEAEGIGGPSQLTKELAVQSARTQQAESLERLYLGRFAVGRQLNCNEVRRIFREGLEKGWSRR